MNSKAKRLIEVALPVKEISTESVRDKSIRHGHISTLHLWWARRPLPVCRAVVFASLVPDPDDPHCPEAFRRAVTTLLTGKPDVYKPYADIPYTAGAENMEDTPRNRLLMFIGKFSETFIANQKQGRKTNAKDVISKHSLIRWETRHNEEVLNIARKLIWVAHDPENNNLDAFEQHWKAIKDAEKSLYSTSDRHIKSDDVASKEEALNKAISAFLDRMPLVYDPFAGGGAIPLESARLGCRSYANDYNPVAFVIEKGSLEFPQKYGKPIVYSKVAFLERYGQEELDAYYAESPTERNSASVRIENRLSFDVDYYSHKLIALAEERIGHYYPADEKGRKPVAYYWARTATCANPSCGAEVPLLRDFYLVNKDKKKVYLNPVIKGKEISFEIKQGKQDIEGWNQRTNLKCPICNNVTESKQLKEQFKAGTNGEMILAIIKDSENGKTYHIPEDSEQQVVSTIKDSLKSPSEAMPVKYTQAMPSCTWGLSTWGQMFSNRQLLAMQTFVECMNEIKEELKGPDGSLDEYHRAVVTYFGILVDRVAPVLTSFGRWHVSGEKLEHPFSRQAIPMIFDYPESNPFSGSTGSIQNQLLWIIRYINDESNAQPFGTVISSSTAETVHFDPKSVSAVITDPPYFDAIAYADLADFFYVWLKRTLADVYPEVIAYPQTPKSDECTALKHHHDNDYDKAAHHFESSLQRIIAKLEHQTSGVISIMFAHQSTGAWTTLCNSILNSSMNITSSWAVDTEMGSRMIAMGNAALASSITVSCRPYNQSGIGDFRTVQKEIELTIKKEVATLLALGFRGADLLTACFGPAVSVFGQYQRVEKASGEEVTVAELLEMARDAAFNAIISDIDADEMTRFYIGWLNLFGFEKADHDDVRRITQVGLNVDVADLVRHHILLQEGNSERLLSGTERIDIDTKLGLRKDNVLIDVLHRAFVQYTGARQALLAYIARHAPRGSEPFWRVLTALAEVLDPESKDHPAALGLLADKDSIIREAQNVDTTPDEQPELF